jgi:lysine-N-methylase
VFLMDDHRCRIHAMHGADAKPWPCRMFPFQPLPAGGEIRVTMRRSCPSAAANRGRLVAEHLADVEKLLPQALPDPAAVPSPMLDQLTHPDWKTLQPFAERLRHWVQDENRPLVWRLIRATYWVNGLAKCKLRKLQGTQFHNLQEVMAVESEVLTQELFEQRPLPSGAGQLLFRQAAAEYVRFHPNMGDRPTWGQRIGLFFAALRIVRGQGQVPRIHPDFPLARFEDLQQPLGPLPAAVMAPLERYFQAMVGALHYCGGGRFGWSLLDGFRALALTFPVAMWTLRWLSHGRAPTEQDMLHTVSILDRSHYYPLLAGSRHRKRLAALATLEDFEKLLLWYAR